MKKIIFAAMFMALTAPALADYLTRQVAETFQEKIRRDSREICGVKSASIPPFPARKTCRARE